MLDPNNYDDVCKISKLIRSSLQLSKSPDVGIICGSGLGNLADQVENPCVLSYKDIPGFPSSTVAGHKGCYVFGVLEGKNVVCMQGRVHPYEGHPMAQCALPVRVMKLLGINTMIVTNAAGGINEQFTLGDLMVINDHVFFPGLAGTGPLTGPNDARFGERFPPMVNAYDVGFRQLAHSVAKDQGLELREGCYAMLGGPTYETPAEIRMLRAMGIDAVGMSTAHEVIVARQCGIKVMGLSLITNISQADSNGPSVQGLHKEVLEMGAKRAVDACRLVKGIVGKLPS